MNARAITLLTSTQRPTGGKLGNESQAKGVIVCLSYSAAKYHQFDPPYTRHASLVTLIFLNLSPIYEVQLL